MVVLEQKVPKRKHKHGINFRFLQVRISAFVCSFNSRLFNWRGFEDPLRVHQTRKCSRSLTWPITFFTTWKEVQVLHLLTQIAPIQKAHNHPPQESRILLIIPKTESLVRQEQPWNQVLRRDLQLQILAQSLKWQPLLKNYRWTIENQMLCRHHHPGKEGERWSVAVAVAIPQIWEDAYKLWPRTHLNEREIFSKTAKNVS